MKPLQVLILEDNPADLEIVLYHLRQAGFEAIWQQAATEAEFSAGLERPLDLILADYQLPSYDGLRALRLLKARQLDIPFILVSGTVGEEVAVAVMKEGAADYLLKHRLMRLGSAVEQALAGWAHRQQKQQVENTVNASTQSYQRLVENLPLGVVVVEAGKLIYVNPAGARIFGAPDPSMILGKAVIELVHPAHQEAFLQQLARLGAGESTAWPEEEIFVRLDEQVIDLEIWATPLTNQNTTVVQLVFGDVTRRKRAEAERQQAYLALYESEERFRATFEQVAVGISQQDINGQFLQVNQEFCEIIGYTRQELLELSAHDITHPDDLDESDRQLRRLWSGEVQSYQLLNRYLHKNGTPMWVNITGSLARNLNSTPVYLINLVEAVTEFVDQPQLETSKDKGRVR